MEKNHLEKYKLIKIYPNSPELDTIIEPSIATKLYYHKDKYIESPNKYPEFWEKIEEKDYQVLSFVLNEKVFTIDETTKKCFSEDGNYANFSKYLKDNRILSVIRLSDGEIFTIGDKVKQSNVIHNNIFTIRGFEMDVNNKHLLVIGNGGIKLSKIEKVKPLFTTEDGVDIFEQTNLIYVSPTYNINYFSYNWNKDCIETCVKEGGKYFSSKEKAEEYIIFNKPCLSINDVLSLLEDKKSLPWWKWDRTSLDFKEEIEKLVKTKL